MIGVIFITYVFIAGMALLGFIVLPIADDISKKEFWPKDLLK